MPAPAAAGGYVEAPAEAPAIRKASKSSNRSDDSSKFHVDMSCLGRIFQLLRIFDAIMNERDPKIQVPGYFRGFQSVNYEVDFSRKVFFAKGMISFSIL